MGPRVSVVIPTYDRPSLVERAIDSVLRQTFEDLECIVVDDCSPTDETAAVVESYEDSRLRYHRLSSNSGPSAARNAGIERAEGEYLAFLDDDDRWLPEKLERQVALLDELDDDVGMVYCWMDYRRPDGTVLREYRPQLRGNIFPKTLDAQPIGACSTLLARAGVVRSIDGFDESLPRGNDGDFIRRVCQRWAVDFVPETLVHYYVDHGEERITNLRTAQDVREVIHGKQTKLRKFPDALDLHPRRKANILAGIAYHHSLLGEWAPARTYFWRAVRTSPASPQVYVYLLRTLVDLLPGRGVDDAD